jgi:hypothetical protein
MSHSKEPRTKQEADTRLAELDKQWDAFDEQGRSTSDISKEIERIQNLKASLPDEKEV